MSVDLASDSASRSIGNAGTWAPHLLAALRIMSGLLYLEHGLMGLVQWPAPVPNMPVPMPLFLIIAFAIEAIGGLLISLGLYTRLAAFICSGQMAVAYFMFHMAQSFWPAVNQGDAAILFCFTFLYLIFAGPGSWSLDRFVANRR